MRFHSRYRLFFTSCSNCSIVTPSAPAAPPLPFTFNHAAQISRLAMSYDLPGNPGQGHCVVGLLLVTAGRGSGGGGVGGWGGGGVVGCGLVRGGAGTGVRRYAS